MSDHEKSAFDALSHILLALPNEIEVSSFSKERNSHIAAKPNSEPILLDLFNKNISHEFYTNLSAALMPPLEVTYDGFHAETISEFLYWFKNYNRNKIQITDVNVNELICMVQQQALNAFDKNVIIRIFSENDSIKINVDKAHLLHAIGYNLLWLKNKFPSHINQLGVVTDYNSETKEYVLKFLLKSRASFLTADRAVISQLLAELAGGQFKYTCDEYMQIIQFIFYSN